MPAIHFQFSPHFFICWWSLAMQKSQRLLFLKHLTIGLLRLQVLLLNELPWFILFGRHPFHPRLVLRLLNMTYTIMIYNLENRDNKTITKYNSNICMFFHCSLHNNNVCLHYFIQPLLIFTIRETTKMCTAEDIWGHFQGLGRYITNWDYPQKTGTSGHLN